MGLGCGSPRWEAGVRGGASPVRGTRVVLVLGLKRERVQELALGQGELLQGFI